MMRTWVAHVVGALVLATTVVGAAAGYWTTYAGWGFIAFMVIMLVVGWFLAIRVPANSLGWIMMCVPALFAVQVPAELLGRLALTTAPEAAAWLMWFGHDRNDLDTWWWMLPLGIMLTQIPLRFPSGRLLSPRWRPFSWGTLAGLIVATAILSTATAEAYPGIPSPVHLDWRVGTVPAPMVVAGGIFGAAVLGSLACTVVRYRRGDGQVRAQLTWMLWALLVNGIALAVAAFVPPELELVGQWILLAHALIPISIAIAVLRYRLYEIDRILSRTTSYALATLCLIAVYAVVVTSVTWMLPAAPAVAVALATLAAAAAFLPALRWIRRRVDRRFDREQYDAERVVDAFGERLRTGADPQTATADLVDAVERTLQPASVGLWTSR